MKLKFGERWSKSLRPLYFLLGREGLTVCFEFTRVDNDFMLELLLVAIVIEGPESQFAGALPDVLVRLDKIEVDASLRRGLAYHCSKSALLSYYLKRKKTPSLVDPIPLRRKKVGDGGENEE